MRKAIVIFAILVSVNFLVRPTPAGAVNEVKYSLAILHYNLQYVAGDTKIENRIIEGALAPMVGFFLKHENWGADFEMQGYMVEQTRIRYPEVFEGLKKLLDRGQVELVSFHYSDQLFLAYPLRDMEWSEMLNQATFKSLGIKRSGAIFTQEGQFGEGMAEFMKTHDYKVLAMPKNLFSFLHGEQEAAPYYDLRGSKLILAGRGVNYKDDKTKVDLTWTYCGDAELLPTGGATPYSEYFKANPDAIKKYEAELAGLEAQGYKIGNMTQYVDALEKAGVPAAKMPPVLDGDWQPADTMNIFRWMGDYHAQYERDNDVLTGNVKARHEVLAAETVLNYLKKQGKSTPELESRLNIAIRALMLAEVSDSTGWTPSIGEVKYSQENAKSAVDIANKILDDAKMILSANYLSISTKTGEVKIIAAPPENESPSPKETDCPVKIALSGEIDRQEIKCFLAEPDVWNVTAKFKTVRWHSNDFSLKFARTTDTITYSPALLDGETVSIKASEFTPEKDWLYLPAPNGLIGLGDDLFLIKNTSTVHVAYHFRVAEKVVSLDMLKPANEVYVWEFKIVKGGVDKALKIADEMNVHPDRIE